MNYNRFNRLLRKPVDDPSEVVGESLSDRMAKMEFVAPGQKTTPDEPTPGKTEPLSLSDGTNDAPDPDEDEDEDEDDDLPTIGEPSKPAETTSDDGDAFEKATAKALAELEAKGHPGEVYKALKDSNKALKKQLSELKAAPKSAELDATVKAELEDLRVKAAEVEGLRQRNEELLRANDQVAVRESEEYKTKVLGVYDEIESVVTLLAEANGLDPKTIAAIVMENDPVKQDKAIDALSNKLGVRSVTRLSSICDDFLKTKALEKSMLDKPDKTLSASRISQEQEQKKERDLRVGAFRAATAESFDKFAKRVPGFTDSSGAQTDLAKSIAAKTAAIDPTTLKPEDLAYMAFTANSFPEVRRELTRLQKENASLRAGRPAGLGSNTTTKVVDTGEPKSLVEKMRGVEFSIR